MTIPDKIKKILEHPLVDTFASFIKKFKSSKSYWSVSSIVILFTLREALAWKWGSTIEAYAQKQLEGTDYGWWWTAVEFVFGIGGSWELVVLGVSYFIILSYVKVNSVEKDEIVKVVKDEHSKTHDKLDELTELLKLQGINENEFLEKYFGKDYDIILQNPQTYHNFTRFIKQTNKSADELLKERDILLKKIASQSFSPKLQNQINKAFKELGYEDALELLDVFLKENKSIDIDITKAKFIKSLIKIEQYIPTEETLNTLLYYAELYYKLNQYNKSIHYYEIALKMSKKLVPNDYNSFNKIQEGLKSAKKKEEKYNI